MFVIAYASLALLSTLCFLVYQKYGGFAQEKATNPQFIQFQRPYVLLYAVAVLGDWLQGPYLYKLYHYHGFLESQVAVIYVCGIVSNVLFTPMKEVVADRMGRKKTAIAFAVLYAFSSIIATIPNFVLLVIGRVIGGVANSFLFASMETWYTHEHLDTHDFPKEWISVTFSLATFASSIVAVLAGVLADVFAHWFQLGPPAPYVLAVPVLLATGVTIVFLWGENYGPENSQLSAVTLKRSFAGGMQALCSKAEVFLVGSIQALFESVIFIFVFIWTPTLSPAKTVFPLGIIFATFMVAFLIGELTCKHLGDRGVTPGTVFLGMTATAGLAFYIGAFFSAFPRITYLCFLIFEFACGIYFPVMGDIREKHLPEQHRLSIVSIFRIPLTVISATTIWLYHYDMKGGIREILFFCGVLMTVACVCALWFARVIRREEPTQDATDLTKTEEEAAVQTA